MADIYNNLIINWKSTKYQPFLFNLVNGRRHLLSDDEMSLIVSMVEKQSHALYSGEELSLYNKFISNKQFMTDESRAVIESKMIESGLFVQQSAYADDYSFSIELTRRCNMSCSFCYVKDQAFSKPCMTEAHIDAIYKFFETYADDMSKVNGTPLIRVTGGEIFENEKIIDLIAYILKKWPKTKLILFTNGVNVLKYYNKIPLQNISKVCISLDGIQDIHLARRFPNKKVDVNIYTNIIRAIKKLLEDNIPVKITTVLDKDNYLDYENLQNFLKNEKISQYSIYENTLHSTFDLKNPLEINEDFNNKNDMFTIQKYLREKNIISYSLFLSSAKLYELMLRPLNERMIPEYQRCSGQLLSKYVFACDGNIYFCNCVKDGDGIIGSFYPDISLNKNTADFHLNRSIWNHELCAACKYKFVCLGGCPLSVIAKHSDIACGIFADEEVLDNLEMNFFHIPAKKAESEEVS